MTFFEFIAEEVRELPRRAGLPHARGGGRPRRAARRRARRSTTGRPPGLDLAPILARARARRRRGPRCTTRAQDHGLDEGPRQPADRAAPPTRSSTASRSRLELPIRNVNRTVGTMLGSRGDHGGYGGAGLPDGTIDITLTGSAGQSFGAFLPARHHPAAGGRRQRLRRQGPVRRPGRRPAGPRRPPSRPSDNVIAGNVIAATARPSARCSCAAWSASGSACATPAPRAVVEGVGDHGLRVHDRRQRRSILGPTGRNFAAGMSGGTAYVLDLDHAHGQPRAGRPASALDAEDDATSLRDAASSGTARRPARRSRRGCSPTGARRRRPVHQGAAARLPAGARRAAKARARGPDPTATTSGTDHGGRPWLTQGFLKDRQRELPRRRPVAGAHAGLERGLRAEQPATDLAAQAGRCMDCGIPFCHNGCPLGNLIPEWNDLVWRGDWRQRHRAAARDQQLPGVHRAAVPGAVRDGLRAGHQPARRSPSSRSRSRSSTRPVDRRLGRPAAAASGCPASTVAVVGSGPAGLAAAQQLTRAGPHRRGLRARRPDRRPAALRHPRVQDGEAPPRPAPRADAAEGTPFRAGRRGRRGPHRGRPAHAVRRGGLADRRHRRRATCRCPGASWTASTRPWSSCRRPTGWPRGRPSPDQITADGQARRRSSAAATPAPTASARRSGRAPRSVTQLEILPRPPDERAAHQPWPTYPMMFAVVQRARGGRRAGLRRVDREVRRRRRRQRARRCGCVEVELVDGRRSPTVAGTEREIPARAGAARDGLHRAGDGGADRPARRRRSTTAATSPATTTYATNVPGVFVAGDAGRGQSLIVWAIAEGRAAAAAVDA